MLDYYKIKRCADSKLRAKVGLLTNNPKVRLLTPDECKIGLLILIFPTFIYFLIIQPLVFFSTAYPMT